MNLEIKNNVNHELKDFASFLGLSKGYNILHRVLSQKENKIWVKKRGFPPSRLGAFFLYFSSCVHGASMSTAQLQLNELN